MQKYQCTFFTEYRNGKGMFRAIFSDETSMVRELNKPFIKVDDVDTGSAFIFIPQAKIAEIHVKIV